MPKLCQTGLKLPFPLVFALFFFILLGNLIVLIPMLLNSHPGTKYGIPFPVFARSAFGTFGANIPAVLRAIVACGWFGINTYVGSVAIDGVLSILLPGWKGIGGSMSIVGLSMHGAIALLAFWFAQVWIIYNGMEAVRVFENWAAPFVLILAVVLVIWIVTAAKGFGPLLSTPSKFKDFGSFFKIFIPSLTG